MSKVVKSVGRAISGVVKGVTKAVSGLVKGVTKAVFGILKSPVGKALLMAGTVYFGGAALMGAMGGASAGTGIMGTIGGAFKGATAGIGNAWAGLKAAGGAVMAGNLSGAGGSLWGGMSGAYSAGQGAVAAANIAQGGGLLANGGSLVGGLSNNAHTAAMQAAQQAGQQQLINHGGQGALAKAVTRSAMINAGSQLAGNVISGMGEEAKYKEDLRQEALARERHNQNVGARLFVDGEYQNEFSNPGWGNSSYAPGNGLLFSGGTGVGRPRYS